MFLNRIILRISQRSSFYGNPNILLINARSQSTSNEDKWLSYIKPKSEGKEPKCQFTPRVAARDVLKHFRSGSNPKQKWIQDDKGNWTMPHPIWSPEELNKVEINHRDTNGLSDKLAYGSVWCLRQIYDIAGFRFGKRTERQWLLRIVFLETVAGVPGMTGAMLRHFRSLRRMQRDWGWIHTLLEEAENERMHLMTATQLLQPGWILRQCVFITQGIFANLFFIAYVVNSTFCHRFVGYLEEEAVKTYTQCLADIDDGPLQHWQTQRAPEIARNYWNLGKKGTMRDVILAIRADEAHHRDVNHEFADMKPDQLNPNKPGE